MGLIRARKHHDSASVQIVAILRTQFVDIAEVESTIGATGNARRLAAVSTNAVATIAFARYTLFGEILRMAVRAAHNAHAAADAFFLVLNDRPVLSLLDGTNWAVLHANRIFAMIAACRIAIRFDVGERADRVALHSTIQRPNPKTVFILARHLARAAANAARHIEVKTKSHDSPLAKIEDACIDVAIVLQRRPVIFLEIAVIVVVARYTTTRNVVSGQVVIGTTFVNSGLFVHANPRTMGNANLAPQKVLHAACLA